MIRGQDIIDAVHSGSFDLETLFSKIKAWHIRVGEKCHMVNYGDWLEPHSEEKFIFGTTGFLREEQAKAFLLEMLSETSWQMADGTTDHRPILLVGQGIYSDVQLLKKCDWKIDLHRTDAVDFIQARYVAADAKIVNKEMSGHSRP